MPSPPSDLRHDPGGTLHLRPHSATALSAVVGLIVLALALDAVIRTGWQGVAVLPVPLLVMALVWAVLWAPRVVLHQESVEVRNVVLSHEIPFAALQEVRLGAMLRLDVTTARGTTATVTAWNAPALGRDNPLRRQTEMHEQELRGRRLTAPERLVHDQLRSRSAVIKERWERWLDHREADVGPVGSGAVMTTRANLREIAVVAVCAGLSVARALL